MKQDMKQIPPGLDDVANKWRTYLSNVPITMQKNFDGHVNGTHCTYHMEIEFIQPGQSSSPKVHYVGRTGNPRTRASTHLSELKSCKTTTRTGKSPIYCADYAGSAETIEMVFSVVKSGLTEDEAKIEEKALSEALTRLYGEAQVLTRPR